MLLLGQVISAEVSKLSSLEESTINVDVSIGYTLKMLTFILFQLMSPPRAVNTTEVIDIESKIDLSLIPMIDTSKQLQYNQNRSTTSKDTFFDANKFKLLPLVLDVFLSLKR